MKMMSYCFVASWWKEYDSQFAFQHERKICWSLLKCHFENVFCERFGCTFLWGSEFFDSIITAKWIFRLLWRELSVLACRWHKRLNHERLHGKHLPPNTIARTKNSELSLHPLHQSTMKVRFLSMTAIFGCDVWTINGKSVRTKEEDH